MARPCVPRGMRLRFQDKITAVVLQQCVRTIRSGPEIRSTYNQTVFKEVKNSKGGLDGDEGEKNRDKTSRAMRKFAHTNTWIIIPNSVYHS